MNGTTSELRAGDLRRRRDARSRSACADPARRTGSASARPAAGPERVAAARRRASRRSRRAGCCRAPWRRRRERTPRPGCACSAASASASRVVDGARALPGERRLLAARRHEQRFVDRARCFGAGSSPGPRGTLGISPSESRCRRSSGSGSWRSADCTAAGSSARRAGFRSPASRIPNRPDSSSVRGVAMARAVVHRAAERVRAQARRERGEIAQRVGRDPGAGALGAEFVERRSDRLEAGDRERFRPVGGHDRVEHERFDVLGVAFGVLERDLRAVGGPVEDELFVSGRLRGSPRCLRPIPGW